MRQNDLPSRGDLNRQLPDHEACTRWYSGILL